MNFLTKVGGKIYIPCDPCSAGYIHYGTEDVGLVIIDVNPKRPAFRYMRRLLGKMKNMGNEGSPSERTNLLYEKEEDELDLDIDCLTFRSSTFDFFVKGIGPKLERFQYHGNKKKSERISVADKPLDKRQRVSDIFGNAKELELVYVGSSGAELTSKDDYWVVSDMSEMEEKKAEKKLLEKLGGYCKEKTGSLDNTELAVLFAVVSAQNLEPLYVDEIMESVEEIVKEIGYPCSCIFDDGNYPEEAIENALERLAEKELVQEVDGRFVALPEYRKGQFEEALYEEFSGLDYIAKKDLVSAAVLLSLSDEVGKIDNILERVKGYGFEISRISLACKLGDLAEEGIVKESYGWFEVNPSYLSRYNPDQLCFDFCKE